MSREEALHQDFDSKTDEDIALLKQAAEDLKAGKIDLSSPGPEEDYKYPSILG